MFSDSLHYHRGYWLISLFLAYGLLTMALPVWRVRRRTGLNPVRTEDPNTPHGYVARLFAWIIGGVAVAILGYAINPAWEAYMLPVTYLQIPELQAAGYFVAVAALVWIVVAQNQMGDSWRVGVDSENRTDLVAVGLYRFSRNPIFLGMIVTIIGLSFALPNAATFAAMACCYVLAQVEVRLEEDHLRRLHGEAYVRYFGRVRRWV